MANVKITNLERSRASHNSDLIMIVQDDKTRTITKTDFVRSLVQDLGSLSSKFQKLQQTVQKTTIKKTAPKFNTVVSGKNPKLPQHFSTKEYVDGKLRGLVDDVPGATINNILKYDSALDTSISNAFQIVHKHYVDTALKSTLKVLQHHSSNSFPSASEGDTFVMSNSYATFANTNEEVTAGDILICINSSSGGATANNDFVILNTNISVASEDSLGLTYIASADEVTSYTGPSSAITPLSLKVEKEASAQYNVTEVSSAVYSLKESEKGLVSVNTISTSVEVTLPSIGQLAYPKFCKYIIKDEGLNSSVNNIVINAAGTDTIQNDKTYVLKSNGASVELYNHNGTWYSIGVSSSSAVGSSESSEGFSKYSTVARLFNSTSTAAVTAASSIEDFSQYNLGEGFKVTAAGEVGSNSAGKTISLFLNGLTSNVTNATTGSPTSKSWILEATVLRSQDKGGAYAIIFGQITFDGVAADTFQAYDYSMDWTRTDGSISIITNNSTASDIKTTAFIIERIKN